MDMQIIISPVTTFVIHKSCDLFQKEENAGL